MLTPTEAIALSPRVIELGLSISAAVSRAGPGGAKVTKAEARQLMQMVLELAQTLTLDVMD